MSLNLSTRARFVALGLATLLVIVGWFALSFRPASSELKKIKADTVASQAQVAQLQTELVRLQGLKANEGKLRADETKFKIALPSDPAVSDFIRKVQDAANKSGLDFLSIAPSMPSAPTAAGPAPAPAPAASPAPSASPGASPAAVAQPATVPGLQTIAISITAKGKFFPMKDFIHRMERLPRALKVNSFSVSAGGQGASPDLSVSLSLAIFESTPIAAPTPPPASTPPPVSSE
jgi:Tfp pilus assembly protein PilO